MKITNLGLQRYSDAFGIPRNISKPLISDFEKWCRCSGEEWTCNRMKSIKLDFIRMRAGLPSIHSWVSYNNGFKGHIGALFRWSSINSKNWSKGLQLLQIYSTLYSPSVTHQQEQKFLSGVLADKTPIPESYHTDLVLACKKLNLRVKNLPLPRPLALMETSPMRFMPHANGRTYPESDFLLESLSHSRCTRFGWGMRSRYPDIFDAVEEGIVFNDPRDADVIDYPNSVGTIGLIQEPGYKLRAVANPSRVYQRALEPLGKSVYKLLPQLTWDCTHDQSKPFPILQEYLRTGKTAYSVDLSGATDYFPLDLQLTVLNEVFPNSKYVRLFEDISRGPWLYRGKEVRWKRGQPLGLLPSFGSFALTHGLLLYSLNNFKHGNMFFVLGDDVIILDSVLHDRYLSSLQVLGCPVSESKSLQSNSLAEFAGKILSTTSVIPQLKWRDVSDNSFMDIVRNIGPKALSLLRPRQRKVAKALLEVPDFLGGLGFNPKGIPLDERIQSSLHLLDKDKQRSFLMSYNRRISHHNYYDRDKFQPPTNFTLERGDFDQKSIAYVLRYLPTLIKWYEIAGKNLYSFDESLPLPIECSSRRASTLEQLEAAIKL